MKRVLTIFAICLCVRSNAQTKILGHYRDYFGDELDMDSAGTFTFIWSFDMVHSWTKGTWGRDNDTVYLVMVPIYDTLTLTNGHSAFDSLILSVDTIPQRISLEEAHLMYSGHQNLHPYPTSLLYRRKRFYVLDSRGKPITKWQKGVWNERLKKYPPWFAKAPRRED